MNDKHKILSTVGLFHAFNDGTLAVIPILFMVFVSIVVINFWETVIFWVFITVGCIVCLFLLKKLWSMVHPFSRNNNFFMNQNYPPAFNNINIQQQNDAFPDFEFNPNLQDDDIPINPNQNN